MTHENLAASEQPALISTWTPRLRHTGCHGDCPDKSMPVTGYSIFWISSPSWQLKEKKKNDQESDMASSSKEKDLNIKRFERALEYFF